MKSRLAAPGAALIAVALAGSGVAAHHTQQQPESRAARQQVAGAIVAALPVSDPADFDAGSAQRAAAAFLKAWHTRDWEQVDFWTSPVNTEADPAGAKMLSERFGPLELSGFKPTSEATDGDSATVLAEAWARKSPTAADRAHRMRIHLALEAGRWVVQFLEPLEPTAAQLEATEPKTGEPSDSDPAEEKADDKPADNTGTAEPAPDAPAGGIDPPSDTPTAP